MRDNELKHIKSTIEKLRALHTGVDELEYKETIMTAIRYLKLLREMMKGVANEMS